MKKVLHIVFESSYGGVITLARSIINLLPEYKHTLLALVEGSAHRELVFTGIDAKYLFGRNFRIACAKWRKLYSAAVFLFKNKYDIIHYHTGGISVLLFSYLLRGNAVVIHHIHSGNISGDEKRLKLKKWQRLTLCYLDARTSQVAVSETVAAEYRNQINVGLNLHVVQNFTLYNSWGKKAPRFSVGYMGRISATKGFEKLLGVRTELRKRRPEIRFLMKGEIHENGRTNIEKVRTNFLYEKPTLNPGDFFSGIDIMLFPSELSEGCPLVILEAAAFDVPVIAEKSKAVVEILGDYPMLVQSFETDAVVEILEKFYDGDFDRGNLSLVHEQINKKHDPGDSIMILKEIYEGK